MAKEIDKIIQSKTAPKSNNVLWDDGENLKINRNGKWGDTIKSVPTNFINNNKEAGGLVNSPFGYEGGSYNEATINATPGEWVFVFRPDAYYISDWVINGVEIRINHSSEELILDMSGYKIKIYDRNVYVFTYYPQEITICCRVYTSKKLLSSNFVNNEIIDLSTEEGVLTLRFLLENYDYYGLYGKIFKDGNGNRFVCTAASGVSSFVGFSIMGFSGMYYCDVSVSGGIFYPLNMTTTIKPIKLEE